jgi:hypothetical protein
MRKNEIFLEKGNKIILPDENKIIEDAKLSFPRHPLYNDVNKKYREGYIRGQVELINSILLQIGFQNAPVLNKSSLKEKNTKPPVDNLKIFNQIIQDDNINIKDKIRELDVLLIRVKDPELYSDISKKIDLLEDKMSFEMNLKNIKQVI